MLPAVHRMRRRDEFTLTVRRGRRAGRSTVVAHLLHRVDSERVDSEGSPRVGFIVARPVGNAVVRNRVRRRLRHLVAEHLPRLPQGSLLVIRANSAAATASNDELAADLASALDRLLRRRS